MSLQTGVTPPNNPVTQTAARNSDIDTYHDHLAVDPLSLREHPCHPDKTTMHAKVFLIVTHA